MRLEVKADPALREVVRLGDGPIVEDRAGIADRDGVILPIRRRVS